MSPDPAKLPPPSPNQRSTSSGRHLQNKLETVPLAANYSRSELRIVQEHQRPKEIMKKIFVFTFIAAATLCAAQVSEAQATKDAKEANKLARDGAEASKNQDFDKAVELLRKAADLDHKYAD